MGVELPAGYRLTRTRRAVLVARADVLEEVRTAITESGTLHDHARARAGTLLAGGRGSVPVLERPGGDWAVRHYRRGGAIAGLLGDRYLRLATPRPFAELAVSAALRAAGVATPEVHAAATYPSGPWYRADVATTRIAAAADLAALTLEQPWPEAERVRAWQAAGRLLAAFFATGAEHRDLNLRNVLVTRAGEAWLLDLDRCTLPGRGGAAARERMAARFHRSRRKLEAHSGRTVGAAELEAFAREVGR